MIMYFVKILYPILLHSRMQVVKPAMYSKSEVTHVETAQGHVTHVVPIEQEANEDVKHVKLSWRSWMVVFCCCFAYVIQASLVSITYRI